MGVAASLGDALPPSLEALLCDALALLAGPGADAQGSSMAGQWRPHRAAGGEASGEAGAGGAGGSGGGGALKAWREAAGANSGSAAGLWRAAWRQRPEGRQRPAGGEASGGEASGVAFGSSPALCLAPLEAEQWLWLHRFVAALAATSECWARAGNAVKSVLGNTRALTPGAQVWA